MLHLLDETLEAFLREEIPLPVRQVDVSFSAPDEDWGAKLSRPTVNLFLWDIRQNFSERTAGSELVEENGRKFRRSPRPRVDCRYLVTAWTTDVGDEHQLLGSLLVAFLSHPEIGAAHLRGLLADVRPLPTLSVAAPTETTSSDFWSAIKGKLKPGLDLLVTTVVDTGIMREAGPAVEQYELRLGKRRAGLGEAPARLVGGRAGPERAGTIVVGPRGAALVGESGEFVIHGDVGDTIETGEEGKGAQIWASVPEKGALDLTSRPAVTKGQSTGPKTRSTERKSREKPESG
jgi:hypothetical protein